MCVKYLLKVPSQKADNAFASVVKNWDVGR